MTNYSERCLVDSCVFVNFLTGGKAPRDNPDWYDDSHGLLLAGKGGICQIYMSVLTIAEVLGSGSVRGNQLPRLERCQRVKAAREWLENRAFKTVEVTNEIARKASGLAVDHQLKGADAVILASALAVGAKILYTWDHDLLKLANKIEEIRIMRPDQREGQLPLDIWSE